MQRLQFVFRVLIFIPLFVTAVIGVLLEDAGDWIESCGINVQLWAERVSPFNTRRNKYKL